MDAMQSFCRVVLERATNDKDYRRLFQPMKEPLLVQLKDRRSMVVRMTCIILSKLVIHRRNWLYRYAKRILSVLFEVVQIKSVEIMSDSAHQCIQAFCKNLGDRKCE